MEKPTDRFNLEQHPESGEGMADLANSEMLAGNFDRARELFAASGSAPEEPVDEARIDWILGYLQAMERPAQLDEAALQHIAGD